MKITLSVKQNEETPVPVEVLAASIVSISEGVKKLLAGPLNDRALHLLIQHAAPTVLTIREIKSVLQGLVDLQKTYVKK